MFSSPLKRFYGFVLKKLVGNFLEDELQLEQLDVALLDGVVSFSDLALDTHVLNDLVKDVPLSFARAKLHSVMAKVPWTNILNEPCEVRVDGLELHMVPSCEAPLEPQGDDIITASRQALLARSLAELDGAELRQKIRLHKQLQRELAHQERQLHRQDVLREQLAHSVELRSPSEASDSLSSPMAAVGAEEVEESGGGSAAPDEGVQVLTSFLERVLSRVEVDVRDINIFLEHAGGAVVKIFIPRIAYGGGREEEKLASSPAAASAAEDFEYHKTVRFRGFRVQLAERKGAPFRTVLAHGDIDRDCEIQLKLFLGTERPVAGPRIDVNCFIASLRLLVRPSDLARLSALMAAVRVSSQEIAARHPRRRPRSSLLSRGVDDDPTDDEKKKKEGGDEYEEVFDIWSMVVNVRQCKFAILHRDDVPWPEDWELSPAPPDTPLARGDLFARATRISGELPRLLGDHLMFSLRHGRLAVQQSSVTSAFALTVAHVRLFEFLLCPEGHSYNRYCLVARADAKAQRSSPLEERHTRASFMADEPHLRIAARSRVKRQAGGGAGTDNEDEEEDEDEEEESGPQAVMLHFEPTAVCLDVGLAARVRELARALGEEAVPAPRPRFPAPRTLDESFETLPEDHRNDDDDEEEEEENGTSGDGDEPRVVVHVSEAVVTVRFPSLVENRPAAERDASGPTRDETVRVALHELRIAQAADVELVFARAFVFLEGVKVLSVLGDGGGGGGADGLARLPRLRIEENAAPSRASRALSVHTDDVFFQSLPAHRVWEEPSGDEDGDAPHVSQADFERACLDDSATVVSWEVPTLLVSLTKAQYDMLMLLYNISVETRLVAEPEAPTRSHIVHLSAPPDPASSRSSPSLSPSSLSSSASRSSSLGSSGDADEKAGKEEDAGEMFQSVVDLTQSVLLRPQAASSSDDDDGDDDDGDVFHSIVVPPKDEQEKEKERAPSSMSSSSSSSEAPSSGFRHFMSLRVWIGHASLSVTLDQTFLLALDDVNVLQCVLFEGKPTTFVSVGARDVALLEYDGAVGAPADLRRLRSMPFLYKTMRGAAAAQSGGLAACVDERRAEQVFRLTVVMKQLPSQAKRDILAVMNFRDLTLQYVMESLWIGKITEFFSSPPPALDLPLPVVEDSVKLFVNAHDCALDFNPPAVPARLVCLVGLVRVSTKLVFESAVSSFTVDVRDVAVLLKNRSEKVVPTVAEAAAAPPCELQHPATFGVALYHLTGGSLTDVLLDSGYVRAADADHATVFVQTMPKQMRLRDAPVLFQRAEVTNGVLNVYACGDSFVTLVQVVNQLVEEASAASVLEVTGESVAAGDGAGGVVERELQAALAQALLDPAGGGGGGGRGWEEEQGQEEKKKEEEDGGRGPARIHVIDDYRRRGGQRARGPPRPPPEQTARWVNGHGRLPPLAENYFRLERAGEEAEARLEGLVDKELEFPPTVGETVLRHIDVNLKLFGGLDWPRRAAGAVGPTRFAHARAAAVAEVEKEEVGEEEEVEEEEELEEEKEEEEVFHAYGAIADVEHLEDYFGGGGGSRAAKRRDVEDEKEDEGEEAPLLARRASQRNTKEVVVVEVRDMTVRVDSFDAETESVVSKTTVAVRDLEVVDALESSDVNKLVCFYHAPGLLGREGGSCQLLLSIATVKSEVAPAKHDAVAFLEEARVRVEFLPVKVNLDQGTMDFLVAFFAHEPDDDPLARPPPPLTFFQSFETRGGVLCIDYSPKHVDVRAIRRGDYGELVNLFPLQDVELRLPPLRLAGIHGWGDLIVAASSEWLRHVSETQSHRYLSGVQPVRSLVNVGAGVADLVLMPLEQVRRDGRLLKGLGKGSKAFLRALALETMKVTSSLASGTQAVLENVDRAVFEGRAPARQQQRQQQRGQRVVVRTFARRSDPPADVSEGLQQAYMALARGLKHAAHNIVAIPRDEYVTAGASASVRSVVAALPRAALKTMIGVSEALSKLVLGVSHTVNPHGRVDLKQRYKSSSRGDAEDAEGE